MLCMSVVCVCVCVCMCVLGKEEVIVLVLFPFFHFLVGGEGIWGEEGEIIENITCAICYRLAVYYFWVLGIKFTTNIS